MDKKLQSLIDFIESHENWQDLLKADPYNLRIKKHNTKDWYLFSYDMIKSDFNLDIVKVCRGIILEIKILHVINYKEAEVPPTKRNSKVIIRAFDKFHNYGEGPADKIDWNSRVWAREKLDGSLIKYTTYIEDDNQLHVAPWHRDLWTTNNSFDASGDLPGDLICEYNSFQDLINEAIKKWPIKVMKLFHHWAENFVFLFELTSPFNRVVVPYDGIDLWWLGVRHKNSGDEFLPDNFLFGGIIPIAKEDANLIFNHVKQPKIYDLQSKTYEEVILLVSKMYSDHEGVVLQDEHFNRVKIKSEAYLSIHRMKDNNGQLSMEHILKCIQNETIDDIIGMFPEYAKIIQDVVNLYKEVDKHLDAVIHKTIHLKANYSGDESGQKKAFAMEVKDSAFSKMFFECYKYNDSASCIPAKIEFLKKLDYEGLQKYAAAPYVENKL